MTMLYLNTNIEIATYLAEYLKEEKTKSKHKTLRQITGVYSYQV